MPRRSRTQARTECGPTAETEPLARACRRARPRRVVRPGHRPHLSPRRPRPRSRFPPSSSPAAHWLREAPSGGGSGPRRGRVKVRRALPAGFGTSPSARRRPPRRGRRRRPPAPGPLPRWRWTSPARRAPAAPDPGCEGPRAERAARFQAPEPRSPQSLRSRRDSDPSMRAQGTCAPIPWKSPGAGSLGPRA
jgi:hypothetical protein